MRIMRAVYEKIEKMRKRVNLVILWFKAKNEIKLKFSKNQPFFDLSFFN